MTSEAYARSLQAALETAQADEQLFAAIVNAPFANKIMATQLDLGIVVLLLVNSSTGTINRIALSNTAQAEGAIKMSEKPFHSIKIPVGYPDNYITRAIATGQPQQVADWKYLFVPALNPAAARMNQAGAGIECSFVYPLTSRDGGALIFSYYQVCSNIGDMQHDFMTAYCRLVNQRL